MAETKSPRFSIDWIGLKKVGKGALIAGAGAILTYVAEALPGVDFGQYTPLVVGLGGVLVNFLRKWVNKY